MGSLVVEIESEKVTDGAFQKFLYEALSTKDLEIRKSLEDLQNFNTKLVAKKTKKQKTKKNATVGAQLPLNNDSNSDDSDHDNNDGRLPLFNPDLFPGIPKHLLKVESEFKSEPLVAAAAAARTNIHLKEEEKLVISDKLNTVFLTCHPQD